MRLAVPVLPYAWTLERHEDGSATVKAPCYTLGTLSLDAGVWAVFAFLFCMPFVLIVGSLNLLQFCMGHEVWYFSGSTLRIGSKLLGLTWQTHSFADCAMSVGRGSGGLWELRLHEPQDCRPIYRDAELPVVLALAAFLAEELGWREEQSDVASPCFHFALGLAFAEDDAIRLRLLLDDPRFAPVVTQAWREAGPVQRSRIKSKLVALARESSWLTRQIEEATGEIQLLAIEILGESGEPRVLPALRQLVAGPPGEARTKAVLALGQMQVQEMVPALCEAVRFEPGLWLAAAEALGEIGDVRAVPVLSELLAAQGRAGEADLRRQIVVALGKIGDVSAIPPLADAVDDPASSVRLSAVEALGKLRRPEAVPPLLAALHDQDRQVANTAVATPGRTSRSAGSRAADPGSGHRYPRASGGVDQGVGGDWRRGSGARSLSQPGRREYASGKRSGTWARA